MTKWGDRPHWQFDAVHLGDDEHGTWLGVPTGSHLSRPGLSLDTPVDQVVLVPREVGWVATFHAPGFKVATYVDITTPPRWDDATCTAVDLDLDVVRLADDGGVYVDDEDEFADHQVRFGYPPEVVSAAEEACRWVLAAVQQERPPFDGACAGRWLDRLADRAGS